MGNVWMLGETGI